MHSLRKAKTGYYYVHYGEKGNLSLSTRTKDRREAEVFLRQFVAGLQNPVMEAPTVAALLTQYQTERGPSVRSQESMKYSIQALTRRLGDLLPDHLLPPVIIQYVEDRGVAPGTIVRELGVLRAALSWAHKHQRIRAPLHIETPVVAPEPVQRWLRHAEADRLIQACHQPHIRLFVVLALMTGARTSAMLELTWDRVDLEVGQIDYGEGHGNKRRAVVPINKMMRAHLEAAREFAANPDAGPVIEFRGERVTSIYHGFKLACLRADLGEDVTPHVLRHTAASWMAQDRRPWSDIAIMLGDSEATVKRVYAKVNNRDYLRETSDKLSDRLGQPRKRNLGLQEKPAETASWSVSK